jgi:hypothetical protein
MAKRFFQPLFFFFALIAIVTAVVSAAQAQGVIRDTEIESDIRRMATSLWQ